MSFDWTVTNSVEQHCRVGGVIVGKIQAATGHGWECKINAPQLRYVGYRLEVDKARKMVERAVMVYLRARDAARARWWSVKAVG